ncbi:hypothetical protein GCM10010431_74470 [Streptomyces kunmingensis]
MRSGPFRMVSCDGCGSTNIDTEANRTSNRTRCADLPIPHFYRLMYGRAGHRLLRQLVLPSWSPARTIRAHK